MKATKKGPASRFHYDWDETLALALASPGEWVQPSEELPHSVYTALVRGKNSLFPTDEFSFRTSGTRYDIDGKRWSMLHIKYTPKREKSA